MKDIKAHISALQHELKTSLDKATTTEQLEQVRIAFLSRKGSIPSLMATLKSLPLEEKKVCGPLLNSLKKNAEQAYEKRAKDIASGAAGSSAQRAQHFDVTAYNAQTLPPHLHVYTHVVQELEDVFISMGYDIADGPEVDSDYYNFEALNIPADHPARDMHDTFWLDVPGMLLRTHTSSVQARAMEKQQLPMAVFAPGRVYRNEDVDASHSFVFMQAEGILIDKNVSMGNLLATAQTFLQRLFGTKDLKIRVRPGYFPFVEPGVEIDASCPFCTNGCSTCKKTGWIELLGAGLVHPNVLQCSGIDPEVYSGFAFGIGIERLAMIKHGINDIRLFRSNKVSFLDQF